MSLRFRIFASCRVASRSSNRSSGHQNVTWACPWRRARLFAVIVSGFIADQQRELGELIHLVEARSSMQQNLTGAAHSGGKIDAAFFEALGVGQRNNALLQVEVARREWVQAVGVYFVAEDYPVLVYDGVSLDIEVTQLGVGCEWGAFVYGSHFGSPKRLPPGTGGRHA